MKKLYVELANTPLKREIGLMGRKKIGKDQGMLFEFPSRRRLSFWMSNTYIPLDIAFINNEGMVTEIKEMIPMSTRCITSGAYCKYALEVNRGWFEQNEIKEGSLIAGFGIKSNSSHSRVAQMTSQFPEDTLSVEPGLETTPNPNQEVPQQDPFSPDLILTKTNQEVLEDAELMGEDLNMMYVTKKGTPIGPKTISPPFTFEEDEDGNPDAIVKCWDNQDASWKSFLIDNIIQLSPKKSPQPQRKSQKKMKKY